MHNEPLTIERTVGKREGSSILRLLGPVTLENVFPFQQALREDPTDTLILDLSGVPYMDSAGMGAILNCYVSRQKSSRKIIMAAPNFRVIELFKLTKVDTLIPIVATLEAAETR
jgi:anti-sigma B factor antagonist